MTCTTTSTVVLALSDVNRVELAHSDVKCGAGRGEVCGVVVAVVQEPLRTCVSRHAVYKHSRCVSAVSLDVDVHAHPVIWVRNGRRLCLCLCLCLCKWLWLCPCSCT